MPQRDAFHVSRFLRNPVQRDRPIGKGEDMECTLPRHGHCCNTGVDSLHSSMCLNAQGLTNEMHEKSFIRRTRVPLSTISK